MLLEFQSTIYLLTGKENVNLYVTDGKPFLDLGYCLDMFPKQIFSAIEKLYWKGGIVPKR